MFTAKQFQLKGRKNSRNFTQNWSNPAVELSKSKMMVQVQQDGTPVYVNPGRGRVISTEKMGARLIVIENEKKAATKVGVTGNWLNVKATNGQSGFIDAGSVMLA